ncbi:nucleotidyltransferase domain-containing protein [Bacillus cereus]|uniref:nucleotidyltransferase domain-containing protein n=1 Tax=Bacillus cereus TaxID=1396 RepID=UPI0018F78CD2|nr:nucleotidyltransferase domain-containing protein [Bacillus cereus]MBJ7968021.1 nucleotidyltransferase domain-containing protein [Bacillus cereus]MBJ8004405.1 nucleotidyltransferase domain-containing protein [Bacillus cereus]
MIENLSFIKYERHKKLVRTIQNDCSSKDEIIGLMLIGSVARGDANPDSDLDLYILLENEPPKKFHSEIRDNILIEYKYADFNQVQLNFNNNPMELYSFLEGKILFDNREFLKQLVEIAQYKYKNYCIPDNKIKGISHWLNSSLIKINAALKVNEELKASYIVNTSTWVMLEGIWAINNKPIPPAGSALVHIKALSNRLTNLDNLLNKVFLGNTTERINSAIIIIEWVLLNLEKKN